MRRFVLAAALLVTLPLAAQAADTYETGRTAAVAQDYAKAREIWEKLAAKGDLEAANSLGYLYQYGLGTPRDGRKALALYTQAAEHGHANAANNIGVMYSKGDGVPADIAKAHAWYSIAAIQGEDSALANRKVAEQAMTFTQLQAAGEESREIIRRVVKNLTPAQIEAVRKRAELYLADAKPGGGSSIGVPRTRLEGAPAGLVSPTQAAGPSLSAPITVGGVGGAASATAPGGGGSGSGGSGPPRDPRLPSLTPMGGR